MIRLIFWDTWEDRWWTCMIAAGLLILAADIILFDGADYLAGVAMGIFLATISWTLTRMHAKTREHKQWMEEMEDLHQRRLELLTRTWPEDD